MTYTHLTPDELVMIEAYAKAHQSVTKTAQMLKRSRQTIYLRLFEGWTYCIGILPKLQEKQGKMWEAFHRFTSRTGRIHSKKSCSRVDSGCDYWSRGVSYWVFCPYPL